MSDTTQSLAVAERQAKPVEAVRQALERLRPQLEMALPRHLTADRLLRVAMTAVQTTPKLLECDRTSLYRAVMMCAQLGLEPDGVLGQAYLIPFRVGGQLRVQFIPGYKGLLSLARNSGEVNSIIAHEVRENDTFNFDFASGDPPHHTFDIRSERGEVIAFYGVARFKDGGLHWDMMTDSEVKRIRDGSQGYRAALATARKYNKEKPESPWVEHFVEMGKKSVIRRIAKYLPMSVQKAAAIAEAYDTGRAVTLDPHGELVIEGDAIDTEEDTHVIEHKQSQLDRFEDRHATPEPRGEPQPHSPAGTDGNRAEQPQDTRKDAVGIPGPDRQHDTQPAGGDLLSRTDDAQRYHVPLTKSLVPTDNEQNRWDDRINGLLADGINPELIRAANEHEIETLRKCDPAYADDLLQRLGAK